MTEEARSLESVKEEDEGVGRLSRDEAWSSLSYRHRSRGQNTTPPTVSVTVAESQSRRRLQITKGVKRWMERNEQPFSPRLSYYSQVER